MKAPWWILCFLIGHSMQYMGRNRECLRFRCSSCGKVIFVVIDVMVDEIEELM